MKTDEGLSLSKLNLAGMVGRDKRVCTNRKMGFVRLLGGSKNNLSVISKKEKINNVDVRAVRLIIFISFRRLLIAIAI